MVQQLKPRAFFAYGMMEWRCDKPIVSQHITDFFRRTLNGPTILGVPILFY
jgi:hypothetical protein